MHTSHVYRFLFIASTVIVHAVSTYGHGGTKVYASQSNNEQTATEYVYKVQTNHIAAEAQLQTTTTSRQSSQLTTKSHDEKYHNRSWLNTILLGPVPDGSGVLGYAAPKWRTVNREHLEERPFKCTWDQTCTKAFAHQHGTKMRPNDMKSHSHLVIATTDCGIDRLSVESEQPSPSQQECDTPLSVEQDQSLNGRNTLLGRSYVDLFC